MDVGEYSPKICTTENLYTGTLTKPASRGILVLYYRGNDGILLCLLSSNRGWEAFVLLAGMVVRSGVACKA
jgi:hypothetical protein